MGPLSHPEPVPRRFGTSVADFLTREFLGDQKLLELYQDAAHHMERSLFVWNHACLMTWYMFDRRRQGKTTELREALAFHLSERDLLRMSSNIFDFVASPEAQPRKAKTASGSQEKDIRLLLDRVLDGFNTDVEEIIHQATVESPYPDGSNSVTNHESYWGTGTGMESLTINEQLESHEDDPDKSLHLPPVTPTTPEREDLESTNGSNPTRKFGLASNSADGTRMLGAAENTAPSTQMPGIDRSFGHKFIRSAKRILSSTSWLARMTRPRLKEGYRRVEWTCDCGVEMYADLSVRNSEQFENLACSLKNPIPLGTGLEESRSHRLQSTDGSEEGTRAITTPDGHHDTQDSSNSSDGDTSSSTLGSPSTPSTPTSTPTIDAAPPKSVATNQPSEEARSKFLALCVNTEGIYKTLTEVDLTGIKSDMAGLLKMKEAYVGTRGLRSRLRFLTKPVTLEFVQFTLWNRKHGYVSICNRPESIPPHTMSDYEYVPKPLEPLPPMPPEIFLHYLDHGEGELNAARHDWLPRLPLRLGKRVIDGDEACYGYGVHIIEGPNRMTIFWMFMTTMAASILACVLWSNVKEDIQGGTSLGALIVALPAAVLAAFLFRFEGV
ncbi:hypothetical protein NCS56_01466600 [Fusarium sp. Ph1]|nr:hypothetical protein NCS56_01466600 [Fusarium sp. Ph1]